MHLECSECSYIIAANLILLPVIIKYPFWQMTLSNENAVYACLNYGEAFCPEEIADRSICIDGDIGAVLYGYIHV